MKQIIFLISTIILLAACSKDDVVNVEKEQLKTEQLEQQQQPTLLIGVTFALLDFAEQLLFRTPTLLIIYPR